MASWRGAMLCRLGTVALALALAPGSALAQATTGPAPANTAPAASANQPAGSSSAQGPAGAVPGGPAVPAHDPSSGATQPIAPEAPFPPRPLRPPPDPTAAAVYAVLEKHCASCHQGGRLKHPAPAAAFGNILRLDELAATPSLIQPGNPDASRLYLMMLRRLMPPGSDTDGSSPTAPTPDEIALVRSWIAGLPGERQCGNRRVVTPADHAATLMQLKDATGEDPKKLRFLSIAHLHNGCVRFEALAAYRQAIVRLFNSLSWKTAPVAVPPVDPWRTLFKVNLDDLGWLPEHWERIMRSGMSPLGLTPPLEPGVRRAFGTEIPVARADWFAKTVLSAPLYYDVLGLPGTGPEILKILQVAPAAGGGLDQGLRMVTAPSSFSELPSLIERHQSPAGPVWQAYHWLSGEEAAEIASGGAPQPADLTASHEAARGMFTLPNGLPGFFIFGRRGERLNELPSGIARPSVSAHTPLGGGLDCMACHRSGPTPMRVDGGAAPRSVASALAADQKAMADAMRRIGIDPDLTLDGVTPIVALAAEYARPVDGSRAAAELGIELANLRNLADRGSDTASVLARRLVQGLVARVEVETHANEITTALGRPRLDAADDVASEQPKPAPSQFIAIDPGPGLLLYSDKARYRKGDGLHLTVRVLADCHLTIISVDTRGRGTVLFPSDFETNGLLTAGTELKLPGPGAPYTLRLNETGRETVVALCNEAGPLTDNIRHDFERQRFTDLGTYATFVSRNALTDQGQAQGAAPPGPANRTHRRNPVDAVPEAPARPVQISRTAISIIVE